jgi:hypothetical protein
MTYDYSAADPSRPRRGRLRSWLSRVLRNLLDDRPGNQDPRTALPVLPVTDTFSKTETLVFDTPAKGDAYNFAVTVELCLCATGHRAPHELESTVNGRLPDLVAEVKAVARAEARRHPIFRPGAAEPQVAAEIGAAVRRTLAGVPDEQRVSLQCSTRVRVDMPDAVRDLQRQTVDEQVKLEARYEHSEQAALRLGELRQVWSKFITDGLADWTTPYAVHMAQQPGQAAATLFTLRKDRKEEAEKLVDMVSAVTIGSDRMDLLEFALATDSALRKTHELLGIAAPPSGGDSLFDEPKEKTR